MGKLMGRAGEGLSGLAGNVVFYSYNGETYFRTVPRKRTKNSWSERQMMNRQRFRAVKAFWSKIGSTALGEIWRVAKEGVRGDNLFVSVNTPAFGPDGSLIDPERLHFSAGKLPLPFRLTAIRSQSDPTKVEVTWQDDPASGLAREDDKLMLVAAHNGDFTGPVATGVLRKAKSAVISLPASVDTIEGIYLFFASERRKLWSVDQYFKI